MSTQNGARGREPRQRRDPHRNSAAYVATALESVMRCGYEPFEVIGGFDISLAIAADVDWFARAEDHAVPSAVIDEVLLHERVHDDNLSSNAEVNTRELLVLLRGSSERRRRDR